MNIDKVVNGLPKGLAIRLNYYRKFKRFPNLKNPKTFNEKLQYLQLKVYGEREAMCSDKYRVRDYVESKGLESILPKLYGVWDDVNHIDFESLPKSFLLKVNHGCGYNIICDDKEQLDIDETKKKLKYWMNEDYFSVYGEFHYKNINRKIICEEFLKDEDNNRLVDYKYFCFNGEPDCILVCLDRNDDGEAKHKYYNLSWEELHYETKDISTPKQIIKPNNLEEMNTICKILAKDFPFVRVDLYSINNKVYFGELTFTPMGGRIWCQTETAQLHMGNLIDI